jgi:putative ABC transport system ATP-binding protein
MTPLIRLRGLRKVYVEGDDTRRLFSDLDLEVGAGERVALLGRSGSGKSTLLNLISGIELADAGTLQIAGQSLGGLDEAARTRLRRRHIGLVFQFFNLIPTLTVAENLLLPLQLNGLDNAEQRQWAFELLDQVGLGERRTSFPERLSGGEQQRLALVRALVHRPDLLLADEPTGNLDETTGAQVLDLLLRLHRQLGTTLLLVTHSQEVARRAQRVLRLEAGRLHEVPP